MNKRLFGTLAIGLLLLTASCAQGQQQVSLYYYDPDLDLDANGNIQCSADGLAPVRREVAGNLSGERLIEETLKLEMAGELTSEERTQGLTTEYPLDGVSLDDVALDNGVLTLTFSDPNHLTSGGACRAGILWLQIEQTAMQFDGVEAGPEKLLHSLQSRMIDVAVAPAGLEDSGVLSRPLWSERLMVVLLGDNRLTGNERIYWQDLRREVFVVPSGGLGPILGNLLSARLTEQGYRPNIIYQDTSLESVLAMITAKRFVTIATEASQGVTWPDLHFREIYDPNGPARLEYALYWREENENPALKRFFKLIEERYPG